MTDNQDGINRQVAADMASNRTDIANNRVSLGSLKELKEDVSSLKKDVRDGNNVIQNSLQNITLDLARLRASNEEQERTADERGKSLKIIEDMLHGSDEKDGVFSRVRRLEESEKKRVKFIWAMAMMVATLVGDAIRHYILGQK